MLTKKKYLQNFSNINLMKITFNFDHVKNYNRLVIFSRMNFDDIKNYYSKIINIIKSNYSIKDP